MESVGRSFIELGFLGREELYLKVLECTVMPFAFGVLVGIFFFFNFFNFFFFSTMAIQEYLYKHATFWAYVGVLASGGPGLALRKNRSVRY